MSFYDSIVVKFGSEYAYLPDAPVENVNDIPPDTIICYDPKGNPVLYKDDTWNYKAYCSRSSTLYNFQEYSKNLKEELKKITYVRIYFSPKSRSITAVKQTPVNHLARWAKGNDISVVTALNNRRYYPFIASSYSQLGKRSAGIFIAMIRELRKIRVMHSHFDIAPPDDELADLLEGTPLVKKDKKVEQTAVIPSRLFSALIVCFKSFLDDYFEHSKRIARFYESLKAGFEDRKNFITYLKNNDQWESFLEHHGLFEFAKRNQLDSKKSFSAYLTDVQNAARLWVHAFTGMRRTEVDTLPYKCMGEISTHGVKTKVIIGGTSKFSSQNYTPTFWVTTEIVELGVTVAQSIGFVLSIDRGYQIDDNDYPLFPQFQTKKNLTQGRFDNAPYSTLYRASELQTRLVGRFPELFVQQSDIRELELFDGFRDWSSFCSVGEPWPLTTHQFRRSLAVYLARSGLVSIGSLQLQYKHLCSAMACYYRKGSAFAVNFIDTDDDSDDHRSQALFMESIEQEKRIAQYLSYESKVIENQENLWGGEGKRIGRAYKRGTPLVIVTDREGTKKRFERGEMAFKESPLGGCTKVGSCKYLSITSITACIDCEHSVLDETSYKKIGREVENLIKERDLYPLGSLLYQHTQDEIDQLQRKITKAGISK